MSSTWTVAQIEEDLRQLADEVRAGKIEPVRMSLDNALFNCERLGHETMAESRERWAVFVDKVRDLAVADALDSLSFDRARFGAADPPRHRLTLSANRKGIRR